MYNDLATQRLCWNWSHVWGRGNSVGSTRRRRYQQHNLQLPASNLSEFQPRNHRCDTIASNMFDATLMCLCALRPFRVYQAIIWHYSNTGRLPDMSVPHKRPERTVEPPRRTRLCCFLFLGWPEHNNGREWTSLRRVGLALHSILISGMQNRRNNTSSSVCPLCL